MNPPSSPLHCVVIGYSDTSRLPRDAVEECARATWDLAIAKQHAARMRAEQPVDVIDEPDEDVADAD